MESRVKGFVSYGIITLHDPSLGTYTTRIQLPLPCNCLVALITHSLNRSNNGRNEAVSIVYPHGFPITYLITPPFQHYPPFWATPCQHTTLFPHLFHANLSTLTRLYLNEAPTIIVIMISLTHWVSILSIAELDSHSRSDTSGNSDQSPQARSMGGFSDRFWFILFIISTEVLWIPWSINHIACSYLQHRCREHDRPLLTKYRITDDDALALSPAACRRIYCCNTIHSNPIIWNICRNAKSHQIWYQHSPLHRWKCGLVVRQGNTNLDAVAGLMERLLPGSGDAVYMGSPSLPSPNSSAFWLSSSFPTSPFATLVSLSSFFIFTRRT